MKTFFLLILLTCTNSSYSQVIFKWLGTTTFVISDKVTTLMFDPAITRIPIYDFLPFRTVKSDYEEVDFWLNKCEIKSVQGTFVNHAHTDHVIDAPYVVKKYGGKLYGSSSTANVGLGQGLNSSQVQIVNPNEEWEIGDFTIRPFSTPHAPHVFEIMFMDGHIAKPLPSPTSPWNYLAGDTYSFLITHPRGSILFQAIGRIYDPDPLQTVKADVLLLTIANRNSSEELIDKRILPSKAKTVFPLHYDNFLIPMNRHNKIDEFWGIKTSEFRDKMKLKAPNVQTKWPHYCESTVLF